METVAPCSSRGEAAAARTAASSCSHRAPRGPPCSGLPGSPGLKPERTEAERSWRTRARPRASVRTRRFAASRRRGRRSGTTMFWRPALPRAGRAGGGGSSGVGERGGSRPRDNRAGPCAPTGGRRRAVSREAAYQVERDAPAAGGAEDPRLERERDAEGAGGSVSRISRAAVRTSSSRAACMAARAAAVSASSRRAQYSRAVSRRGASEDSAWVAGGEGGAPSEGRGSGVTGCAISPWSGAAPGGKAPSRSGDAKGGVHSGSAACAGAAAWASAGSRM